MTDEMDVTESIDRLRELVAQHRQSAADSARPAIGCVMTMGALHAGHRRLIETSVAECAATVVTIYVNPTQFAPGEDFAAYPRPLEADLEVCRAAGAAVVLTPTDAVLYPPGFQTVVTVEELTKPLEGATRPSHFRGVTTVVLKLLNIVQPDVAYFGQKDFQQQATLRRMTHDLNVPCRIATVPTVREADGLALSSRNAYLDKRQRRLARILSRALRAATERWQAASDAPAGRATADETSASNAAAAMAAAAMAAEAVLRETFADEPDVALDYARVCDSATLRPAAEWAEDAQTFDPVALVAARVGSTRLIDNHRLAEPFPAVSSS